LRAEPDSAGQAGSECHALDGLLRRANTAPVQGLELRCPTTGQTADGHDERTLEMPSLCPLSRWFNPARGPFSTGVNHRVERRREHVPCGRWPSPSLHRLGKHMFLRFGTSKACVTKLQHSLNATARRCRSLHSDRGIYSRACVGRVAPESHVGYDWMVHRHLPSPGVEHGRAPGPTRDWNASGVGSGFPLLPHLRQRRFGWYPL